MERKVKAKGEKPAKSDKFWLYVEKDVDTIEIDDILEGLEAGEVRVLRKKGNKIYVRRV